MSEQLKFENDDARMNIEIDGELAVFEIWNVDHWNIIHLSKEQFDEIMKLKDVL